MRLNELQNRHLIAACAFFIPTLGVYLSGFFMPLMILVALLILGLAVRRKTGGLKISWIAAAFFIALAAWGGLSSLWSIAPERSLAQAFDIVGTAACGLVLMAGAKTLEPGERRLIGVALLTGFGVATLFATFEVFTNLSIYRLDNPLWGVEQPLHTKFNRWTTLLTLLTWPILLSIGPKPPSWKVVAIFALVFAIIVQLENASSLLGLLVGATAFVFALNSPKKTAIAFICLTMAGVALAPHIPRVLPEPKTVWAAMPDISTSVIHRLYIWRYVADRIEERPITGWGLDTGRNMPGRTRIVWNVGDGGEILPLHPHNAILQWWMELGLVGAVIGGLCLTWLFVTIQRRRMNRFQNAAFTGALAAGIVVASTSYGIWQAWWLAGMFLVAAIMVGLAGEEGREALPEAASPGKR
ncbi:MAG: O-antigen ligase family protein [Alphaproteobacteria bacterium]